MGQSAVFTYEGSHGPEKWGSLSPSYATCSNGKFQSPVDISKDNSVFGKKLQTLVRKYNIANATLTNNGVNIGVGQSSPCFFFFNFTGQLPDPTIF